MHYTKCQNRSQNKLNKVLKISNQPFIPFLTQRTEPLILLIIKSVLVGLPAGKRKRTFSYPQPRKKALVFHGRANRDAVGHRRAEDIKSVLMSILKLDHTAMLLLRNVTSVPVLLTPCPFLIISFTLLSHSPTAMDSL